MSAVVIRPVGADERAAWEPLWRGYLEFYKTSQTPDATDIAWRRLHDPNEPMYALGAYVDGKLLGIVHYLYHRSFWTTGDYCYLQDLFVAEATRGQGLGRALIEAVYAKAGRPAPAASTGIPTRPTPPRGRFTTRSPNARGSFSTARFSERLCSR